MEIADIKENGKCCSCQKPLNTSVYINMVQLDKRATWDFPIWGNIITGQEHMAVAYICDSCFDEGKALGKRPVIIFAIDTTGKEIKYHPIENL